MRRPLVFSTDYRPSIGASLNLLKHLQRGLSKRPSRGRVRGRSHRRLTTIPGLRDRRIHGNLTEKIDFEFTRQRGSTATLEDVDDLIAMRTFEAGHVLHDPQDRSIDPLEHAHGPAYIAGRDILRGGDHDGAVDIDGLHDLKLSVTRPRRHVDD